MKSITISILKNSSCPLRFFTSELEEAVFDETYRFCNVFSVELEEADFDKTFRDFDPEELLPLQRFFHRTRRGRFR